MSQYLIFNFEGSHSGEGDIDLLALISFIPVHPLHPRRKKAKDDVVSLEQIARKPPASFSPGMKGMNGDGGDRTNKIKVITHSNSYH